MNLFSKFLDIESKLLRVTILLEIVSYFYVLVPVLVELVFPDYWTSDVWFAIDNIKYILLVPFFTLIFTYQYGLRNTRVMLTIHIGATISVMSGVSAAAQATTFTGNGDLANEMIFSVIPAVTFGLSILHNSWAIALPYEHELSKLREDISQGNLRPTSSQLAMNDGIFGQFFTFIHDIIADLRAVIVSTQLNVDTLVENSDNLYSGAEEINAVSEEVASTSQAMSQGASSQTELIFHVNQQITDLRLVFEDIISKIQMNTK